MVRTNLASGFVLLLSLIVVCLFLASLRAFRNSAIKELRTLARHETEKLGTQVCERLDLGRGLVEFLADTYGSRGLTTRTIRDRTQMFRRAYKELGNVVLREPDGEVGWSLLELDAPERVEEPFGAGLLPQEERVLSTAETASFRSEPDPEEERVLARARELRVPLYSRAMRRPLGDALLAICAPAFKDNEFAGAICGYYSLDDLLTAAVPKPISARYQVSLLDEEGAVVAELASGGAADNRISATLPLSALDNGLSLRLVSHQTGIGRYAGALGVMTVGLVFGLSLCVWLLARDLLHLRRARAELKRAYGEARQFAAHLVQVREEERIRIARELHDELGSALTGSVIDVAWLRKRVADAPAAALLEERLDGMNAALKDAVQTMRNILTELRPRLLDDVGLVAAIEWQAHEFEKRTGVLAELRLPARELDLAKDQKTALFRILQEALTNVARHAEATEIRVSLEANDGRIVLEVRDNGRGIAANAGQGSRSLGLLSMRERAALLGGVTRVLGDPGQGTAVIVDIPKHEPIEPHDEAMRIEQGEMAAGHSGRLEWEH